MSKLIISPTSQSEIQPLADHLSVEYEQTHEYIRHMHDTRHSIFNFFMLINGAIFAAIVQYVHELNERLLLGILGLLYSIIITLMARRSLIFLKALVETGIELESSLGLGIIQKSRNKMPNGVDSNTYISFVYLITCAAWLVFDTYILINR